MAEKFRRCRGVPGCGLVGFEKRDDVVVRRVGELRRRAWYWRVALEALRRIWRAKEILLASRALPGVAIMMRPGFAGSVRW